VLRSVYMALSISLIGLDWRSASQVCIKVRLMITGTERVPFSHHLTHSQQICEMQVIFTLAFLIIAAAVFASDKLSRTYDEIYHIPVVCWALLLAAIFPVKRISARVVDSVVWLAEICFQDYDNVHYVLMGMSAALRCYSHTPILISVDAILPAWFSPCGAAAFMTSSCFFSGGSSLLFWLSSASAS
jgi:hypothetical protein